MSPDSNLLSEETINQAVALALKEIQLAKNLDELKNVRLNHAGEKSPIALANREIGSLQGVDKADAGKRIGEARNKVKIALDDRTVELQNEREDSILIADQRLAGLGIAVLALILRAPFPVVVLSAAATSAAFWNKPAVLKP
jgi:hypothetical protein